jgi:hypothetical protein
MKDMKGDELDRAAAIESIRKLSEADLRFLNSAIVERLRNLQQTRVNTLMSKFHSGDFVQFAQPDGTLAQGIVQRVNIKTITVVAMDGHIWKVPPNLLTRIPRGPKA